MPNSVRRVYWDSNVLLSFIENDPNRASDIQTLMEQAEQGKLEIVTSTISIAEVAFAEEERAGLSASADESISALWRPPSPIKLVEFHAGIAEGAKHLLRTALSSRIKMLKPMDAIHLATAIALSIEEIHTYDDPLARYADLFGLRIVRPFVEQTSMELSPAPPISAAGQAP
jgi:predicted nucleic acid-binding protein